MIEMINARDSRRPWELPEETMKALIEKFEAITEKKFDDVFADQVNNFIGILREKYIIDEHVVTKKEIKRELTKLRNALKKASDIQSRQIGHHSLTALYSSLPGRIEELNAANQSIDSLVAACDKAIEKTNNRIKSKEFSFPGIKQAMATELARELDSRGVNISAYREGIFSQCLREFLTAFNGETNGREFRIYVAEDLFQTVQKANEDYLNVERFFLLSIR